MEGSGGGNRMGVTTKGKYRLCILMEVAVRQIYTDDKTPWDYTDMYCINIYFLVSKL